MKQQYTCDNCGTEIDYQPSNERSCSSCGYPLDLSEMLEFLKANQSRIQKVECSEFSAIREIGIVETFRQFGEHEDLLFPESFTESEVIVSIENKNFRIMVQ